MSRRAPRRAAAPPGARCLRATAPPAPCAQARGPPRLARRYSHVTFHRMQGRSSDERVEIAQAHLSSVESLLRPMQAITAFFLGLFVSLVLGRW